MSDDDPAGGGPQPMPVRLDVAREFLIDRVFNAVQARNPDDIPARQTSILDGALERVVDLKPSEVVGAGTTTTGASLARTGYQTRIVERQLFDPARRPMPGLADLLEDRRPDDLAAELARAEPLARPDPDDPHAASWRVPGPGGHVRHYLAVRAAEEASAGTLNGAQLKRCWLFGFFLCCCEESE